MNHNCKSPISEVGSSKKRPYDRLRDVSRISLGKAKKYIRTNDEIHRSIKICPIVKLFLDTPQLQRLRSLHQLGTASLVYNNATHTRHEHSLGVAHLAQRLVKHIQENQPGLGCTHRDCLCITLAGLFHDTGHGPFSHVFEEFVTNFFPKYFDTLSPVDKARYDNLPMMPEDFCHEDVSLAMIDAALAHYGFEIDLDNLDKPPKEIGCLKAESVFTFGPDREILTSRDFVFIKECIFGSPILKIQKATGLKGFVGRPGWEKEWMYDIVSNRHSGLDVDKMDYFARDSKRCYGDGCVDEVVVEDAVVAWGDCTEEGCYCDVCSEPDGRPYPGKHLMICYPEKTVKALINFFNTRYKLHDTVYRHKTTAGAAHMVCDILCHADPFFWIRAAPFGDKPFSATSDKPEMYLPPSRAGLDVRAFVRLRDNIIHEISNTPDERMEKARSLACRFICRDLYKCPADYSIDRENPADLAVWKMSDDEIKQSLLSTYELHSKNSSDLDVMLYSEDFIVEKYSMHHGRKDRNPIENIRVVGAMMLSKLDSNPRDLPIAERPRIEHYKALTPMEQEQSKIRIFCRDATKYQVISHVFAQWLQDTNDQFETPSHYDDGHAIAVSQCQETPDRASRARRSYSSDDDNIDDLDGSPQIVLEEEPSP